MFAAVAEIDIPLGVFRVRVESESGIQVIVVMRGIIAASDLDEFELFFEPEIVRDLGAGVQARYRPAGKIRSSQLRVGRQRLSLRFLKHLCRSCW